MARLARWPPALLAVVCIAPLIAPGSLAAELPAPASDALQALLTTSELAVGPNRFAFGLSKQNQLIADANAVVRIYDLREPQARLVAETAARYHMLEVIEDGKHVHVHPDGTRHLHGGAGDVRGIYVAHVTFDRAGSWGVEILVHHDAELAGAARLRVEVLKVSRTPMLGTPAPRSRNLIASDVGDLSRIDSSEPPDSRLHQIRIADAIAQRRPQLIVFATPRFCASRVCGPVVDVVRTLIPAYGHRVAFIHQEIWEPGPPQRFSPTIEEWKLPSEPWIFVVDRLGMIRAKFEGLTTRRELEAALRSVLEPE